MRLKGPRRPRCHGGVRGRTLARLPYPTEKITVRPDAVLGTIQ
jgi:hypothetical protein